MVDDHSGWSGRPWREGGRKKREVMVWEREDEEKKKVGRDEEEKREGRQTGLVDRG